MYYDLTDLSRYYTQYSADFAARTHSRASDRLVGMNIYDDNHTTVGKKIYYPSGRVEVIL